MNLFKRFSIFLTFSFVVSSFVGGASAQVFSEGFKSSGQRAVEGVEVQLVSSDDQEILAVRIFECQSCQPKTFLPGPGMQVVVGDESLSVSEALARNGRGGAVLYNPETEMAEIVVFYGQ